MMADKPSIAILPFTNMSGDPEQEYFSDGIAEDIITDLSKISACSSSAATPASPTRACRSSCRRSRAELGRQIPARRQRPQGGQTGPGHRPADRRAQRRPLMGRSLRSRPDRHFRHPGRDHQGDRRPAEGPAVSGGNAGDRPGADGQCRGLHLLSAAAGNISTIRPNGSWGSPGRCSTGRSSSIRLRPCLCRHGNGGDPPGWLVWRNDLQRSHSGRCSARRSPSPRSLPRLMRRRARR